MLKIITRHRPQHIARQAMSQRKNSDDSDSIEDRDDLIVDRKPENKNRVKFYRTSHFRFFVLVGAGLGLGVLTIIVAVVVGVSLQARSKPDDDLPSDPRERAEALLQLYPVIDG